MPENPNAFPEPSLLSDESRDGERYIRCDPGMTLRDYFAAAALNGLASARQSGDAMLAAREKK